MATTEPTMPVNGNYAHHQAHAYGSMDNNYVAASANTTLPAAGSYTATPATNSSGNNAAEIPKDEVGWYFVEQYYTTLSRSPDKLFLFYNKRSQFVSGIEEEKVSVCIGQKSINDRIKELDFHDCKVRVTNVDSQGSDQNIVIQVIGEISNKGQPHKKFCQTFVLAEQTNGYFVLNDIFRYIAEEPEDDEEQLQQEPATAATGIQEPVPTAVEDEDDDDEHLNHASELQSSKDDIAEVDNKLEEVIQQEETTREVSPPPAEANGTPIPEEAEVVHAEDAPVAAVSATEETTADEAEQTVAEEVAEPEKPKDPEPSPAAPVSAPKPAKATAAPVPAPAPKPAAPRTWAALVGSANRVATPNLPSPTANTTATSSQPKATPSASAPTPPPATQAAPPVREPSPTNSQGEAGWQTAGAGHKKEQSRSQNQAPAAEAENKRAYIKNVGANVEDNALKTALSKYGEVEYCDISRQKNCAFVDFKTAAGFQAAVAANPHKVNGEDINVEERRLRPAGNFPFPRGGMRGRGGPGGPGGRGNFPPRGRGSMGRGRGAPPPA